MDMKSEKQGGMRTVKAWAGFSDGKIDLDLCIGGEPPHRSDDKIYGAIYRVRKDAPYEDVRRVEIRELPRKKRKKK
jgi:hypothetical protein